LYFSLQQLNKLQNKIEGEWHNLLTLTRDSNSVKAWLILPRACMICLASAVAMNPTAEKWIGGIVRGTMQGGACFFLDSRVAGTANVRGGRSSGDSIAQAARGKMPAKQLRERR
jgi:hypothetical protein